MMQAGTLRDEIVIESPTETQGTAGEVTTTWATFATRRAEVEALAGRERFLAQQVAASIDYRVRLRRLDGVTPKMRVRQIGRPSGDRLFDIRAVLERERGASLELLCEARQP